MLEIRRVPLDHEDAQKLVAEVQAEYVVRYGGPDDTPIDPAMFQPPDGAFFVGYRDGLPVASGAWRRRPDVTAFDRSQTVEIKRMYVAATLRRSGLARVMLAHLEDTAREAGADVIVLETGSKQPEAIALYTSSGYTPVEGFGHYKDSPSVRYFGKPLT